MKLSDTDKREVCPRCGWVGRRAFQQERHDLCEATDSASATVDETVNSVDDTEVEVEDAEDDDSLDDLSEDLADEDLEVGELETVGEPEHLEELPRWSRTEARRRGIPPKKTLAVRRITQKELADGRAELEELGADDAYERPKKRGDCQWCPVCQLVRDGKSDGSDRTALRALGRSTVRRDREESLDAAADRAGGGAQAPRLGRLACGHCADEVVWRSRPCVFVACKQSLYLDVSDTGSIILNFPHLEPGEMPADQSCALDLAERGAMTLEEIAVVTNLTRERIRQVELRALVRRARPAAVAMGLGSDDAAAVGSRHRVGPGADLEETGVEGAVPSDVATLLTGGGGGGGSDDS